MERLGISRETSRYLLTWLQYAYRDSLRPDPNDRIYSDLHVLPEDSGDLVTEYFDTIGKPTPEDLDASELYDPTLAELGQWLESFRAK